MGECGGMYVHVGEWRGCTWVTGWVYVYVHVGMSRWVQVGEWMDGCVCVCM